MITDFNWGAGHTHYYGLGSGPSSPFWNGYLSLFAVIGADNECYFNGNSFSNVEPALNLALASFGIIELTADFDISATNSYIGDEIQFTDTSIGNVTGWSWDFGDGGTSAAQNPSYTYNIRLTLL